MANLRDDIRNIFKHKSYSKADVLQLLYNVPNFFGGSDIIDAIMVLHLYSVLEDPKILECLPAGTGSRVVIREKWTSSENTQK